MILDHLKTQTAKLHKETEQDNLARFILDHTITTEQYADLLRQNAYAYGAVDAFLNRNSSAIPDYLKTFADGSKSRALHEDLNQLGYTAPNAEMEKQSTTSEAQILGMLYVTEGSMLGGLLIRKNLANCKQLPAHLEHHFFGKTPQQVMARWQAFKEAVADRNYSQGQLDEAVAGAHDTFGLFQKSYSLF